MKKRKLQSEPEELCPKTIKNIQKSLEDIKAGRISSHEEVKKRLGLNS